MILDPEKILQIKTRIKKNAMDNAETAIKRALQRIDNLLGAVSPLAEIGIQIEVNENHLQYGWNLDVKIEKEKLIAIRGVLGKLEIAGKDIADAEAGIINVYVEAEDYKGIRFVYQKTLSAEAKCKIKFIPGYTSEGSHQLVCEPVSK